MTTAPAESVVSILPCNPPVWRVVFTDGHSIRTVPVVCWGLTVSGRVVPMTVGTTEVVPVSALPGFLKVVHVLEETGLEGVQLLGAG